MREVSSGEHDEVGYPGTTPMVNEIRRLGWIFTANG